MAKKPTRLRFTEDDLSSASVSKAAGRADKAADKAEKAVDKLPGKKKKSKLRQETDKGSTGKNKLRFDKAKHEVEVENLDTEGFQLAGSLLQHSDLMRDRNVGKVRIDGFHNLIM